MLSSILRQTEGSTASSSERGKKKRGGHGGGRNATATPAAAAAAATPAPTTLAVEPGCDGPAVNADAAVCLSATSNLLLSTDHAWNADTGATVHMTPHRTWFIPSSYVPWRIPINLANNNTVYLVGKGDVLFQPEGDASREVLISNVLHVPPLSNNLFSVLTLTSDHGFTMKIVKHKMSFTHHNTLALTATVNNRKVAYLDGYFVGRGASAHAHHVASTLECAFHAT